MWNFIWRFIESNKTGLMFILLVVISFSWLYSWKNDACSEDIVKLHNIQWIIDEQITLMGSVDNVEQISRLTADITESEELREAHIHNMKRTWCYDNYIRSLLN